MTIEFNCRHCDKVLKTSEDKAGRQAKCPGCGEVIEVPQTGDGTFVDVPPSDERVIERLSDEPPPVPASTDDTKPCPICGEPIKTDSIRCRFCGEIFESSGPRRGRLSGYREMRPFPPGEVIADAWRIYTGRMGLLIGSFMAMSLLTAITSIVGSVPVAFLQSRYEQGDFIGTTIAGCVAAVFVVLTAGFAFYLHSGYLALQVKAAREQPVEFGDLFSGGRFCVRMLLNSLLFGLMVTLGGFACLVPGMLLALMFFPFGHALVDEDRPGIESLARAKELTDGNWGSLLIVLIVAGLSLVAGTLACYVGLIFALPFANLLYAVTYDRMTCQTPLVPRNRT